MKFKRPKGSFFSEKIVFSVITFIVFFISISLVTYFIISEINTLKILIMVGLGIVCFISGIGILLSYILSRNVLILNEKGIQVPCPGYEGYFFPALQGEGYEWRSTRKQLLVSSTFKNIAKAYIVTDEKEKESIKTNRALYNVNAVLKVGGVSVRMAEIPSIIKDLTKDRPYYLESIKKAFMFNYAMDPSKTVAITFKKMQYYMHAFLRDDFKKSMDAYEKIFRDILPKLDNLTMYVSVDNPEKLIQEINSRIKAR